VAGHPELKFEIVNAVFGLGIIYSQDAPWAAELAARIQPYIHSLMLERMEENRVQLYVKVQALKAELLRRGAPSEVLPGAHPLEVFKAPSRDAFFHAWDSRLRAAIQEQEHNLPAKPQPFDRSGYCVVCGQRVNLRTDYEFASTDAKGRLIPSWRERQICQCRLNCRIRSCFHFLKDLLGLDRNAVVYATEQVTALFPHIKMAYPRAVGSENLGSAVPRGRWSSEGIRNEDLMHLTFGDRSLDCVASFDRLQCVPDHQAALREMARCLRPGGKLLLTVPFHFDEDRTVLRASRNPAGELIHHQPSVCHHDPANPQGALCYHDFGWDLLPAIEQAGFHDAALVAFTAPHFGYLGMQYVITATRAAEPRLEINPLTTPHPELCQTPMLNPL